MAKYFGKEYTNIGTTSDPVWRDDSESDIANNIEKFDTGWVNTDGVTTLTGGATLTFSHSLGERALASVCSVYAAEDAQGTNMQKQDFLFWKDNAGVVCPRGIQVKAITDTQITIQIAIDGYAVNSSAVYDSRNIGVYTGASGRAMSHIRLVVLA